MRIAKKIIYPPHKNDARELWRWSLKQNLHFPQAFELRDIVLGDPKWFGDINWKTLPSKGVGQLHAEALIASGKIPDEWKRWEIILPGTLWNEQPIGSDNFVSIYVALLEFQNNGGRRWRIGFRRINAGDGGRKECRVATFRT